MITLSLCMIVKDEEKNLNNCLSSCSSLFDEIIIVDTGSTDRTKEIAKKYTNNIYDFKWCDDFSKARNYSFSKATKEYIMWLDADDIISKFDFEKLKNLKHSLNKNTDIVMLKYNLEVDENNIPALTYYRERVIKNDKTHIWQSPIHETIKLNGKILYFDAAITHNKKHYDSNKRNLNIFNKMLKENVTLDARQTFYYARELYYNKEYEKAIKIYNEFFYMQNAWKENKISACIDLYTIYSELNQKEKAIESLFNSFKYDTPRAEICCLIGNYFFNTSNYYLAIYWYNEALSKEINLENGGFYSKDYYNFIPYINLCVCYYKLGDINTAINYNELAGSFKPNNKLYIQNRNFFKTSYN